MSEEIRVLHVDDEPDMASLTRKFLERQGDQLVVESETDPNVAVDRLDAETFDCVVSDYEMPEMTGIQVLEIVREKYPDRPFILFTGKGSEEIASEAISSGVSDYLQKQGGTSQYDLLANRIENAVEQYRAAREVERTERRYHRLIEEANDAITIVDEEGRFEYLSPAAERVLGYTPEELVGELGFDYFHPDDLEQTMELFFEMVEDPGLRPSAEFRFKRPDGSWMWLEVSGRNLADDPDIGGQVVYAREITERKRRERELEQYRTLVENVGDPMYILDEEGRIVMVNDVFEDVLGYDPEEVIGWSVYDVMPEADVERGNELIRELLEDEARTWGTYEMHAITAAGEKQLHETRLAPLTEDGEFVGSVGAFRDITERKERERALRRERDRLEVLFENLPNPVIHVDLTTGEPVIERVNSRFEETFGYENEAVVGRSLDEVTVPDEYQDEASEINRQILEEGQFHTEVTRQTADGRRDFVLNGVLRDPDEDNPEGYAIYTDITERKYHEHELETIRERMAFALAATDSYIYEVDLETGEATRHGPFERLYNLSQEEIPASDQYYGRAVHPDDQAELRRLQMEVLPERPGETHEIEYRTHPDAGEVRWIRSASYVHESDTSRLIGLATDVTERKEHEWELAKSTAKLEALISAFPDVTVLKDEEGNELQTFAGPDSDHLVHEAVPADAEKRSVHEVFEPDQVEEIRATIGRAVETGETQSIEYELDVPAGRRWFEARIAPVEEPIEGEDTVAWVARDITDRKQRERELRRQNERLEEFASVVSHDLRNPLSIAAGHLESLTEDPDNAELEVVERSLDRMEDLIEDLLALAREGQSGDELTTVDLAELADRCWANVETERATLVIESDLRIRAYASRLQQLLENLMRNAVEHAGPDVTITVGSLGDGRGFFVADDGPGIPPAERDQVFERGYSTSDDGTGFGLGIVRDAAASHGWEITLTESESGGARFELSGVVEPVG